jgi:hypothetical protein
MQTWIAGINRLGEVDPNVDRGYRPPRQVGPDVDRIRRLPRPARSNPGSGSSTASATSIQTWIGVIETLGHPDPRLT